MKVIEKVIITIKTIIYFYSSVGKQLYSFYDGRAEWTILAKKKTEPAVNRIGNRCLRCEKYLVGYDRLDENGFCIACHTEVDCMEPDKKESIIAEATKKRAESLSILNNDNNDSMYYEKLKRILLIIFNCYFGYFIIFAVMTMILGGDAINGYKDASNYYLGDHGTYTEVNRHFWNMSYVMTIVLWFFAPIGMVSILMYNMIKKRD